MAYAGHTWTTGDVITAVLLNALDTSYTALNAKAQVNGDILELYHGANKKIETSATGGTVTGVLVVDGLKLGNSEYAYFGSSLNMEITHTGGGAFVTNKTGLLSIYSTATNIGMTIGTAVSMYYDNSVKLATTNTGVNITGNLGMSGYIICTDIYPTGSISMADDRAIYFGGDADMAFYHTGANAYFNNDTGTMYFTNATFTETAMTLVPNGAASLYYDNSVKLATATDGVAITGACKATNFEVGNNIITDSTTTRTFALTDNGMYIRFTSASDVTATIPLNSAVAFPIGTIIECINAGDSDLTITKTAGVTLNSADSNTKLTTQFKAVTLKKVAADVWDVIGLEE